MHKPQRNRILLALSLGLALGVAGPARGEGATAASGAVAGQKLFTTTAPPCSSCHAVKAGAPSMGPALAGVAARAQQTVKSPAYKGKAKDARGYLRESILEPNAHIVAGQGYGAGGRSLMPAAYGALTPAQLDQLVDYMMSLQ